jgi:predicted TIM-barrel fold metal-dependent hydrolase
VMLGDMQVEFASALAGAYNSYQIEEWLAADPRFRGSVHVAPQDPHAAAREIDRVGPHPQMVQVLLGITTRAYGDPFYFPIFEAAQRNGLKIATHHTVYVEGALGMGRYYIERHMLIPQGTMAQIVSLVCSGVFDRFPELGVVCLEGGFTWLPHLMWRMDREYKSLRQEVPWVKRLPSEHIRERVRLATQPAEDLSRDELVKVIDLIGSDEILMFATDYPHFDFDSPLRSLPPRLSDDLARKIFCDNARAFYELPDDEHRSQETAGAVES